MGKPKLKKSIADEEILAKAPRLTIKKFLETQQLYYKVLSLPVDLQTRFVLRETKRELDPQLESYTKAREDFLKTLSNKEGDISVEDKETLNIEQAKLFKQKLNISTERIPESAFGSQLSVLEVDLLNWLIEEGK